MAGLDGNWRRSNRYIDMELLVMANNAELLQAARTLEDYLDGDLLCDCNVVHL